MGRGSPTQHRPDSTYAAALAAAAEAANDQLAPKNSSKSTSALT